MKKLEDTNHETNYSSEDVVDTIKKTQTEHKNGGPYTKLDQEKRREIVRKYHFDRSYSAVKIADMIGVNRNTVNDDIKYIYSQIAEELGEHTVDTWALMQYQRMEAQRQRLLILLEDQSNTQGATVVEKMLSELDERIDKFISPIISRYDAKKTDNEITDDAVKEIVKSLVLKGDVDEVVFYGTDQMLFDIIKMKKCDIWYAKQVVSKMDTLGFELCRLHNIIIPTYDLARFAMMRGIISENELKQIKKKIEERREYESLEDEEDQ